MPYYKPFIKLSWGGSVRSDDEWTNAIGLAVVADGDSAVEAFANLDVSQYFSALRTCYTQGNVSMAAFNTLSWVKAAVIGTNGKYIGESKEYTETPIAGGNTGSSQSPQDSLVVSLLTTTAQKGPGARGRIYPPAGFVKVQPNGLVLKEDLQAYADKFAALFTAIEALKIDGKTVQIVNNSFTSDPQSKHVDIIAVGNVMDVQRRRRNKLTETYVSPTTTFKE